MEESIEDLLDLIPNREDYEKSINQFSSLTRKREWLSVRILLYTLLGEDKLISYYPTGRPYLSDNSYHISISHTREYVAIILSTCSYVGIDIEQYGERVQKLSTKFIREDEKVSCLSGLTTYSLLLHWSAKEVIFKCLDKEEVDFRKHIRVYPFNVEEEGEFMVKEFRTQYEKEFVINYFINPDFVCTWTFFDN